MKAMFPGLVLAVMLAGCATNPITGRQQLKIASDESVVKESKVWYRSMMGEYYAKGQLKTDPAKVRRTVDITNRLIDHAVALRPDAAAWDWDLEVINSKELNAFCMAGGKMAIYSGLIDELKLSDDEIASVMGHEIAHALVGHSAERMSVSTATNLAVLVSSYALGRDSRSRDLIYSLGGVAAMALISLPHSRSNETEADEVGLRLAAMAGFNPNAGATVWQKMAQAGGQRSTPEFLSTHPSNQKRQDNLASMATALISEYENGVRNRVSQPNPWIRKEFNELVKFDREDFVRRIGTTAPSDTRPGPIVVAAGMPGAPTPQSVVRISAFNPSNLPTRFESHSLRFDVGREELNCRAECVGLIKSQKKNIEKLEAERKWKQLASSVLSTNYQSDLNYYRLARAAHGLGNSFAAVAYYAKAAQIAQSENTACRNDPVYACPDMEIAVLVENELREIFVDQAGRPR